MIELPWVKRVRMALDAASGMTFLHSLEPPIVHRDLKSMNLLVTQSTFKSDLLPRQDMNSKISMAVNIIYSLTHILGWTVKIADFGTARLCALERLAGSDNSLHDSSRELSDSFALTKGVGTLMWNAPEIIRGLPYGQSADVYSFGIVLWEIMSRELPFKQLKTRWEIKEAITSGKRPEVLPTSPAAYANLMV